MRTLEFANLREVVWAMSTRSEPQRSIEIISRTLGGELNSTFPLEEVHYTSRAIIDVCKPFEWKEHFVATVGVGSERDRRSGENG